MSDHINKLVRNNAFVKLSQLLGKFNFFYASTMALKEVRHTKFLAYLLTPNESHGLKEEFLRRFLTSLPYPEDSSRNVLNLFDCDLSHANVETEKVFITEELNNEQKLEVKKVIYDVLIKIPSVENQKKSHIIIIENKLNARQGRGQLDKYFDFANKNFKDECASIHYIYLNLKGDEDITDKWIDAKYSETVIPVVEGILSGMDEVISEYLAYILKDYREVLIKEGVGGVSTEEESLLNEIFSETGVAGIIGEIKNDANLKSSVEWRRFQYEYRLAWDAVEKYKDDYRLEILKHYSKCFKEGVYSVEGGRVLYLESSSINCMRFSFLDEDNAEYLKNKCSAPDAKKWVSSARNLCFELCLSDVNEKKEVICRQTLTLGPTNPDFPFRNELYNCIRQSLTGDTEGQSTANATIYYSSIKRGFWKKVVIKNDRDGKKWIDDVLRKVSTDGEGYFQRINSDLRKFFVGLHC